MTKKVFIGILVSILLSLCTSFCFAANNTDKINLGNDVSSSINKGMDSVGNAVRDVAGFGERTADDAGSAIDNMGNGNNRTNTRNNNGTNNNGMYNGNYSTTRTSADGAATTAGMSTTAWMWVIFAIAAVIIIAAIWYYAMQGNDRD